MPLETLLYPGSKQLLFNTQIRKRNMTKQLWSATGRLFYRQGVNRLVLRLWTSPSLQCPGPSRSLLYALNLTLRRWGDRPKKYVRTTTDHTVIHSTNCCSSVMRIRLRTVPGTRSRVLLNGPLSRTEHPHADHNGVSRDTNQSTRRQR